MSHISKLNQRNVTGALSDYASNAVVLWVGNTQGLGGIYSGVNIHFALQFFIGNPISINFTDVTPLTAPYAVDGTVIVTSDIYLRGLGHIAGNFNGTISAFYSYVDQNGVWLISQEEWNFVTFTVQYATQGCC